MPVKTTTTTTNNTTNRTTTRATTGSGTGTPTGWNTITANVTVPDVQEACEFYQTLGFELVSTTPGQGGVWAFAQLTLGGSSIMLGAPQSGTRWIKPTKGGGNLTLYAFVGDVDNLYQACKKLGYTIDSGPQDQVWGDRTFNVTDPFGVTWTFATHVRDVSPSELQRAVAGNAN